MQVPVNYLISRALRLVGAAGEGQPITGEQANDACYTLNTGILDAWNADGDMIFNLVSLVAPLTRGSIQSDGTVVFTIGPDLTNGVNPPSIIVTQAPTMLEYAAYRGSTLSPSTDIPLDILTAEEYAQIRIKSLQATISYGIYMDTNYPVANIYLWPVSSTTASLYLVYEQSLPTNLTLSSTLSMPRGYVEAIRLDLACRLWPEFRGSAPVPESITGPLAAIKGHLKYDNKRSSKLTYSGSCQGVHSGGMYDILTDEVY